MLKKIIPVIVLVVTLVVGYIGFKIYNAQRFLGAITTHIKNTSLRVTNAARYEIEEESKVTYKELFEKFNDDIVEIEKRLLDVQTISNANTKEKTDPIVDYLKASQEFLRSLSSKYKKQLALTSAMEWTKQKSTWWSDESSYAWRVLKKAQEDENKAEEEYQEAIYGLADAIGKLANAKDKIALMVGQDVLVDDGTIQELKKRNPTMEENRRAGGIPGT